MITKLLDLAMRADLFIGHTSDSKRVGRLLESLRPVETDKPLIRLGSSGDGGYLVPDDLAGLEACFSPGVDVKASFEADLVARGIPCFLADASVDGAPIQSPLIDFERKFVGVTNDPPYITMDDWVAAKLPAHGDAMLLQMDIEAAEWPVLLNMSAPLLRAFRIIVIEMHFFTRVFDYFALPVIDAVFSRLLEHFHVVHIHPNNFSGTATHDGLTVPRNLEMTLIRKDRITVKGLATRFPHPLDEDCAPGMKTVVLPATMHG